jgi:hypothetical protein
MSVDYRDVLDNRGATVWAPRPHDRADCPLYPFNDDLGYDLTNPGPGNMSFVTIVTVSFVSDPTYATIGSYILRNTKANLALPTMCSKMTKRWDGEEEAQRPLA